MELLSIYLSIYLSISYIYILLSSSISSIRNKDFQYGISPAKSIWRLWGLFMGQKNKREKLMELMELNLFLNASGLYKVIKNENTSSITSSIWLC